MGNSVDEREPQPAGSLCRSCGVGLEERLAGAGPSGDHRVLWCAGCSMGITAPFQEEKDLASLYATGAYRASDGKRFNPLIEQLVGFFRNRQRSRILAHLSTGSILDIGCGRGSFLKSMVDAGWSGAGVELNDETARYARSRGLEVFTNLAAVGGTFDVITLNHVLEHVPVPESVLRECRRLLKKGGVLIAAAPNLDSLQARFGGRLWLHLDIPYHRHHFSEAGLARLVTEAGFSVSRVRRLDLEHNPFGWIQTLLNRAGFPANGLYHFLKLPEVGGGQQPTGAVLLLMFVALVPIVPLAYLLSVMEAAFRMSGTVEIWGVPGAEQDRVRAPVDALIRPSAGSCPPGNSPSPGNPSPSP